MHICGIGERKPGEDYRDGGLGSIQIGICEDCNALNDDLAAISFSDFIPGMPSDPDDEAPGGAEADVHPDYCGGPCTADCGLMNDVYFAPINVGDETNDIGMGAEADDVSADFAEDSAYIGGISDNDDGFPANVVDVSDNDASLSDDIYDYAEMAVAPRPIFPADQQQGSAHVRPKRARRTMRRPRRLAEYEPSTEDEVVVASGSNGAPQRGRQRQNAASGTGRQQRVKASISAFQRVNRRILSNERERIRMHGLNDAFECLREIIPHIKRDRRLSKIETLSMARYYISSLIGIIIDLRTGRSAYFYAAPEIENAVTNAYTRGLVKFPRELKYYHPRLKMDRYIYEDFIVGLGVQKCDM